MTKFFLTHKNQVFMYYFGVFALKTDMDEVIAVSNYFGRALGNALTETAF